MDQRDSHKLEYDTGILAIDPRGVMKRFFVQQPVIIQLETIRGRGGLVCFAWKAGRPSFQLRISACI